MRNVTHEHTMAPICMSHGTHTNESGHTYEGVMSHIRMSQVTHMRESCHTYKWVMSHIWGSHVTRINESVTTHAVMLLLCLCSHTIIVCIIATYTKILRHTDTINVAVILSWCVLLRHTQRYWARHTDTIIVSFFAFILSSCLLSTRVEERAYNIF